MEICDLCGNATEYPLTFSRHGSQGVFDSFECAIHALAPVCGHCGCRIIGHPIFASGKAYCCDHCVPKTGDSDNSNDSEARVGERQVSAVPEYEQTDPL